MRRLLHAVVLIVDILAGSCLLFVLQDAVLLRRFR
jgi:hypothetical protein